MISWPEKSSLSSMLLFFQWSKYFVIYSHVYCCEKRGIAEAACFLFFMALFKFFFVCGINRSHPLPPTFPLLLTHNFLLSRPRHPSLVTG